ncbi:MFS transporter [Oceanicoccus sagamiensis]|uniref:MFS transporter n=1 Tax=Oceanicoccus sagamiensis TaxID=716816 RepID=UPI0026AB9301
MISPELKQAIFNRRMLICVFTGFSSGLPLYVIIQLLQVWLRENNASLTEIGLFALVGMPYTLKFLWAPLMDRYTLPLLGRRRGWLLPMQIASLLLIGLLGMLDPQLSLLTVAYMALALAFFSASQDIVLDALRREILPDSELGLGNTIHVQAYRIAGLVPGSLALILADFMSWTTVFWIVAAFMLPGIAMTLLVKEPPEWRVHRLPCNPPLSTLLKSSLPVKP